MSCWNVKDILMRNISFRHFKQFSAIVFCVVMLLVSIPVEAFGNEKTEEYHFDWAISRTERVGPMRGTKQKINYTYYIDTINGIAVYVEHRSAYHYRKINRPETVDYELYSINTNENGVYGFTRTDGKELNFYFKFVTRKGLLFDKETIAVCSPTGIENVLQWYGHASDIGNGRISNLEKTDFYEKYPNPDAIINHFKEMNIIE